MANNISAHQPDTVGETLDVFHRGAFHLVQPAIKGHRSGVDAMILASSVPQSFSGQLADLGSGAGAAGLAVAARCKNARVTLIERSGFMLNFAHKSVRHPLNAALLDRVDILEADVSLTGKARAAAGLIDDSFDFVIMNPPFNEASDRSTPDPVKAEAHVKACLTNGCARHQQSSAREGVYLLLRARVRSHQYWKRSLVDLAGLKSSRYCRVPTVRLSAL